MQTKEQENYSELEVRGVAMTIWDVRGKESWNKTLGSNQEEARWKTSKSTQRLRHVEGTFPQTDVGPVTAGIRINTSNVNGEKFKRERLSTCDTGIES